MVQTAETALKANSVRRPDTEALVIGAGPAGASAAIRLARLGWRVTLVEQACFPRQKVCGECLGPASLELLDELGLGSKVSSLAGPAIREVAWMVGDRTIVAQMPACLEGRHAYGCALGRDCLDMLLLAEARTQGVEIVQPAKVRHVSGVPGNFRCIYVRRREGAGEEGSDCPEQTVSAAVVIDAHGSWERAPRSDTCVPVARDSRAQPSDLLAFKTTFEGTALAPGMLPVLCLPGGYGGMIVSDRGRTTIACCIRRETLRLRRVPARDTPAGEVIENYLRNSCEGVATALRTARRQDPWQAVGPLRTGLHMRSPWGVVRIGNAGAEAHPVIGEGICMALQSASVLARLCAQRPKDLDGPYITDVQRAHAAICRREFSHRLRIAQLYARVAMRPTLATTAAALMNGWPAMLTAGAQLAGKAKRGPLPPHLGRAIA
jgi:menaquinone-9 beta-reductase